MNKGINNKSTYKEISVKRAGKIRINLYAEEKGIFFDIPIYQTPGVNSMSYNLSYSTFLYKEDAITKFNEQLLKYFTISDNEIIVKDAYGKETHYLKDGNIYKNEDDKTKITYDSEYIYIKDYYDNELKYAINSNIPESYIYQKKELISGGSLSDSSLTYQKYGDVKVYEWRINGRILEIKFTKNEVEVYKVELTYTGNDEQSHSHYKKIGEKWEPIFTNTYIFKKDQIKVTDNESGYYVLITGSYSNETFTPKKIEYGYNNEKIEEEEIGYNNSWTSIYNDQGYGPRMRTNYHFKNGMLSRIMNYKGQSKVYEYDERKNRISGSKWYYNDYEHSKENSILCDYFNKVSNTWNGNNLSIVSEYAQYSDTYGYEALKISSTTATKTLIHSGFKDSFLTMKLWSRKVSGTSPLKIKIKLFDGTTATEEYNYEIMNTIFDLNIFEQKVTKKYSSIELKLETNDGSVYHVNGICLYDTYSKKHYYYDSDDNVIKVTSNEEEIEYSYDKRLKKEKTIDTYIKYNRDGSGYITSKICPYGAYNKIGYDTNYNIVNEKVGVNDKCLERKYEYQNNYLIKEINERKRITQFTTNELDGLIKEKRYFKDGVASSVVERFYYDKKGNITKFTLNNNSIDYLTTKTLNEVGVTGNAKYKYYYDNYERLTKITIQDKNGTEKKLIEYFYDNTPDYKSYKIVKIKKYGTDEIRIAYSGNFHENIVGIYQREGTSEIKKIEYEYDLNNNVKKIKKEDGNEVNFNYDKENRLIKCQDQDVIAYYSYNKNSQIVVENEEVKGNKVNYINEENKVINLEDIYAQNYQENDLASTFFDDPYNDGNDEEVRLYYKGKNGIEHVSGNKIRGAKIITEKRMHYGDFTNEEDNPAIGFRIAELSEKSYGLMYLTIGMWLKPTTNSYGFLGEVGYNNILQKAKVKFYQDSVQKVVIKITDDYGKNHEYQTNLKIEKSKWNFFVLTIVNNGQNSNIKIKLNENTETFTADNYFLKLDELEYLVVGSLLGKKQTSDRFTGYIGNIIYTNRKEISQTKLEDYYEKTKRYIFENEDNEEENPYFKITTTLSPTKILDSGSTLPDQIYPLNQTLNSLTGDQPIIYISNQEEKYNGYQTYKYDKDIKHSGYFAVGQTLVYEPKMKEMGTVGLKTKIKESRNTDQVIFELYQDGARNVKVYRDKNKSLYVMFLGKIQYLETKLEDDELIEIVFSYYKTNDKTSGTIKIKGKEIILKSERLMDAPKYLSIGAAYQTAGIPLYGIITNLVTTSGYYFSNGSIQDNYINEKIYKEEYNEIGQCVKVTNDEETVKYEPEVIEEETVEGKTIQKITNSIKKEIHSYGEGGINNKTFEYEYDYFGRVVKKITYQNDTKENEEEYEYSESGELTGYKNIKNNQYEQYYYDKSGNQILHQIRNLKSYEILEQKIYTYNDYNQLIKIDEQEVKYNDEMNIIKIGNDNLEWKHNLLLKYNENEYAYDEATKLRKSKQINGIITKYYYNNSRLVYEETGTDYIRYIYSQDGKLIKTYAKVGTKNYKITIRRDILGNIIGLIDDSSKEEVVRYEYSPYGNVKISGTLKDTANKLNNIIYKGYYYDGETGYFWLSSRYYSPELCRFISPDDVDYLDPSSINGLNLYSYCGNDPINRYDPSGHFWDYVLDAAFIAWGVYDLINGGYKDWKNWVALGVDIVFAVLPFVPSGAGQVIKVGNKIDNAVDVASAINKIDNIQDMSKVTMIGRGMDRVTDTATLIGKADNLYDAWKGYDVTATGLKKFAHDGISMLHDAGWMFGKLRSGYTVIDIGMTTLHRGRGLYYGAERFVIGLWKTRNLWKLPINYYF